MPFFDRLEHLTDFHRLENQEFMYDSQFWHIVRTRKIVHFILGIAIYISIYLCFIPTLYTISDENPEVAKEALSKFIEIPSDLITAFSYFLIPFMLLYIIHKRNDIPFNAMFWMFSMFIFCCGMTHLLQVFQRWFSFGWSGAVIVAKFLTSGVSFGTAIVLLKSIPLALRLPSRQQLEDEIAARISAQQKLGEQYRRALMLRHISENLRVSLRVSAILSTACSEIRAAVKASRCIIISQLDNLADVEAENNAVGVPSVRTLGPISLSEHPLFKYCRTTSRAVLVQDSDIKHDDEMRHLFQQWNLTSLVIIRASYIENRLILIQQCNPVPWTLENISLIEDIVSTSLQPCIVQASLMDSEQKREIAERSSQAKSEFLAIISHEIRTPMNAILGTVQIMRDSNLTKEQSECLKIVSSNGKSLLSLLNLLLDFSRIESESFTLDEEPFDLKHAITKSTMLLSKNTRNDISLTVSDFPPNLPDFVIGDKLRLRQILINLISNAIKFTEQGEVRVSAKLLQDIPRNQEYPNGGHILQFDVQDTGIGIPRDQLNLLFKPFSQIDSSLTRRYEGTGLGLAICSKLCERMGGQIWVNSTYGVGSTFSFTVKVQRVAQGYQHKALVKQNQLLATSAERAGVKILVAEDNNVNQMVAVKLLEKIGYTNVKTVSNGKEAISLLEKEKHDIVLMDLHMPEMDGLTATKEIRKRQGFKHKPYIIAVTANVQEATKKKCVQAGMNDFIEKPFKLTVLNELINKAIVNSVKM